MYSGGDLVKLLREKSESPLLQQRPTAEEGTKKQECSPCLAAHLTLLNNLARNDLNFQNLLVLHNLVSLGLDFGEDKRPSDHRTRPATWDQRRNCLAELISSFGKQGASKDRGSSGAHRVMTESQHLPSAKTHLPEVVMGYPAAEYRESAAPSERPVASYHDPNGLPWDVTVHGHELPEQHYTQRDWMPGHWNQWMTEGRHYHRGEASSTGGFHQAMNGEETDSPRRDLMDSSPSQEFQGDSEDRLSRPSSLQKCRSWSEPAYTIAPEGSHAALSEYPGSSQASIERVPVPYRLENEIPLDWLSDLERLMEAATPVFPPVQSEQPSIDSTASFTMDDLWQFYELPSVYGLQVPFLQGGKSVSFAHFVPSLSAIRLFTPISSDQASEGEAYLCDIPQYPHFMRLVFEFFETVLIL